MIMIIIIINDIVALFSLSPSLKAITLTALLNLSLIKKTVNAIAMNNTNVFIL